MLEEESQKEVLKKGDCSGERKKEGKAGREMEGEERKDGMRSVLSRKGGLRTTSQGC